MTSRFDKMTKISADPAAKQLARANTRLDAKIAAPASAPPLTVLEELSAKGETIDLLRLLAILLPPRERVWWACLAARDIVGAGPEMATHSLLAAEAWVRDPSPANRETARGTIDHAYVDDDTVHCATAVMYADGTLGPGDLANHPAPAGAAEMCAFAMNMVALREHPDIFEEYIQTLIDRAVDIGRGGNGRLPKPQGKLEKET